MKALRYNQGLAALTTMVIVLVILVVLIASYGLITSSIARQFSNVYQSARAFYVSEAGAEDGITRYTRSGGTLNGSWNLVGLSSGASAVEITSTVNAVLTTTSDVGSRKRKIQVTLNLNPIYTYAGLIGDGGLWMSDETDIRCVSGNGCKGVDEAGDAGTIWVNGPIWANGSGGGGKYASDGDDARIVGHAYTIGKVDIRPSEKKEPIANTAAHKFVCLTDNPAALTAAECNAPGVIKATAIAQKVRIHESGNNTKRAAFRVAYQGNSHQLPTVRFYPVRQSGSTWSFPYRVLLEDDSSATADGERLFSKFKVDTNHDGAGEALPANTPEWVYFNIPSSGLNNTTSDDTPIYIVLQADAAGGDANSYYKVYYDTSSAAGTIHTGGHGQYLTSGGFCPATSSGDCYSSLASPPANQKLVDDRGNERADFHFRLYSHGSDDDDYENSLQVFGELHADEAIGATVIGEGSSASYKDIAFVGRRFATAFWKDRPTNNPVWGYSFAQQFDNCDLGGSGTETQGDDLESRRGWRTFCDSQVRNVWSTTYGGTNERRYSVQSSLYPVLTGFYCNPYKNAGSVTHGGSAASCVQDSPINQYTPYEFNAMAQSNGRGCYFACGNGENTSCGPQDIYKTHYIYPVPNTVTYGAYPYNFCKYAGGTLDEGYASEAAFKSMLGSVYGIAADLQDLYLPKAPPPKGPWPISDAKIDSWISSHFNLGSCLVDGSTGDDTLGDNAYTVRSSRTWSAPTCINGNLVVRNAAKITLNGGAHVYVTGNIHLLKDPNRGGAVIEMNNSSGASGWPANNVGLVIVNGYVDTEPTTQFLGGSKSDDEYMLVVSRSTNMGEYDPYDWAGGGVPATSEYDVAAIYSMSRQDGGATVSFYAPNGSVVLERNSSNPNAMQVAARKLVMRRGTQLTYDYGVLDMVFPGGPASASGVSDYDEIAP